jgi:uncharacterized protein
MQRDQIIEALSIWNFWETEIDTGIRRKEYLDLFSRYLSTDEIVTVTGIRRSGKSTLLLQLLKDRIKKQTPKENTLYINFEEPKFHPVLSLDFLDQVWQAYLDFFKPSGLVYLVLDEVQRVKGWEQWVRSKYDRKEKVKVFVTGSNTALLSSEFSSVLTGRHLEAGVWPLSFKEFLSFQGIVSSEDPRWRLRYKKDLARWMEEYLIVGGFPKVVLTQDPLVRKELLGQYFNDILTRDVAERHQIKETAKLKNLALLYFNRMAGTFSYNRIKKIADFSLSLDTVQRFSLYLEESFLLHPLLRFSFSLKNQMQAQRKIYLADNGLYNAVAFRFSPDRGKLLENAVFQQLKRTGKEIYYFSEKKEVDFIVKEGLEVTAAVNVCYDLSDRETYLRELSGLQEAMKYFGLREALLITAEAQPQEIMDAGLKTKIVPFYQWALEGSPA